MKSARNTALVTGGNGITGRNLVQHLEATGQWEVIVTSHSPLSYNTSATFIQADLLQPGSLLPHAAALQHVTHIFFGSYIEQPTPAAQVSINTALLQNLVSSMETLAPELQHITFIQGGKAYGAHFGIYKTPALETDPRHFPPNFYYAQEDYLREQSAGKNWSWTALRPDLIIGPAIGNPMNLASVIAIYATFCKALNVPFRFPGTPQAYDALLNVTDAGVLAQAMEWAALTPAAHNDIFNITNGDVFRWNQVWPAIAAFFELEYAAPQPFPLEVYMADKGPLWEEITRKHQLQSIPLHQLVQWAFGDAIFRITHDAFFDVNKARRAGFNAMTGDSTDKLLATFQQLQAMRIIP